MKMTFTFDRDDACLKGDEWVGDVFTMVITGVYYPGAEGCRVGHPDNWDEDINHDFEVISAVREDTGEDVEVTDRELRELTDIAANLYGEEEA